MAKIRPYMPKESKGKSVKKKRKGRSALNIKLDAVLKRLGDSTSKFNRNWQPYHGWKKQQKDYSDSTYD